MPHLIDELTPEETKKIERIDAYYRPLLNASTVSYTHLTLPTKA